jgi:hypothetical protein
MFSHDTDWCWCSPMIKTGADCLPWYRLMLFVSHDVDRRWCSPMIQTGADVLHLGRQAAPICIMGDNQHQSVSWENISTNMYHGRMFSHDKDWCWLSPMIQINAVCLAWCRSALMFPHDTDWCWCSPMIHISTDVLPWYRLVLHHARQTALICIMGESQHQSLSWENISTSLYHGRTLATICIMGEH